jgi:hypothetical protein
MYKDQIKKEEGGGGWVMIAEYVSEKSGVHVNNRQCLQRWSMQVDPKVAALKKNQKTHPWTTDQVNILYLY